VFAFVVKKSGLLYANSFTHILNIEYTMHFENYSFSSINDLEEGN